MKSLSSRQVRWAQELSRYHFRIDYCQEKANAAADTLSHFPQRSQIKDETLKNDNSQIFHHLQTSLTRANITGVSFSGLALAANLFPLYQVLICGTHVRPQLCQFWTQLRGQLAQEEPYQQVSIGCLRLRLLELQLEDQEAQKIRKQGLNEGWEENKEVLHHKGLSYMPEIVRTKLISRHHDDSLADHFGIDKTRELITQKYYWLTLRCDVEAHVKGCNISLT